MIRTTGPYLRESYDRIMSLAIAMICLKHRVRWKEPASVDEHTVDHLCTGTRLLTSSYEQLDGSLETSLEQLDDWLLKKPMLSLMPKLK